MSQKMGYLMCDMGYRVHVDAKCKKTGVRYCKGKSRGRCISRIPKKWKKR
jgi:hypothetical protein